MKKQQAIAFISISFLAGFLVCFALKWPQSRTQSPPVVTIQGSLPTLYQLHENFWGELSANQKFDVSNTIINIEASYLGIDVNDIEIEIDINSAGHEALETILYTSFKKYQMAQISAWRSSSSKYSNLLLFKRARFYFEESDLPYSECSLTELDAKQYALERKDVYLEEIEKYLFKLERAKYN